MNPHLLAAYVIFCGVPIALATSLWLRCRNVKREIRSLQAQAGGRSKEKPRVPP